MEPLPPKGSSLNEGITHRRREAESTTFSVRESPGIFQHPRLVTLSLGLLSAILLLTAIVIIVVLYGKVNEDDHQLSPEASELLGKLKKLQADRAAVTQAHEELKRNLERERASHVHLEQEIDSHKAVNDDHQRHIVHLQKEKSQLQGNITEFTDHCGRCLSGWVLLNSSCYFVSDVPETSKRNWPSSRTDCVERGSDLLVVDSWEEQELIIESIPRRRPFWIGLTDVLEEGTWVWINNVTQHKQYWGAGQPDSHRREMDKHCAVLFSVGNPKMAWMNERCLGAKHNWICEMQPM